VAAAAVKKRKKRREGVMMWLHASNSTATAMYGLPWLQGKANVFGYRRLLFSYTTNQPVSQPTPFFIVTFTKVSALVSQ
jgi:hypothetical protein